MPMEDLQEHTTAGQKHLLNVSTAIQGIISGTDQLLNETFTILRKTSTQGTLVTQTSSIAEHYQTEQHQIDKIHARNQTLIRDLTKPNEIIARTIASLYQLHYGKTQFETYPLDEETLRFLSRIQWRHQSVFEKGIQKYRIGQKMIETGQETESVRKQLLYATHATWNGQKHHWPENGFRIKGIIPLHTK